MKNSNKLNFVTVILAGMLFSTVFLCSGCGEKGTPGFVGYPTEIFIDLMSEEGQYTYQWTILVQPDASMLSTRDITSTGHPAVFEFIPDAEGFYTFEVNVSQYGDDLFTEIHSYSVREKSETESDEEPLPISSPVEEIKEEAVKTPEPKKPWLDEEFPEDTPVEKPVKKEVISDEPTPKPVKPSTPRPGSTIPYLQDRYTIQVASSTSLEEAEVVVKKLIESGYDAYIQKAHFKETDTDWFRVRVGSYEKRKDAVDISKKISASFGYSIWIDFVRKDN